MANHPEKQSIQQILACVQRKMKVEKTAKGNRGKYRDIEAIMAAAKAAMTPYDVVLWRNDEIVAVACEEKTVKTDKDTKVVTEDSSTSHRIYVKSSCCLVDAEGNKTDICIGMAQEGAEKAMNASQRTGSAATYAQRRALSNLFAIDDGSIDPDATQEDVDRFKGMLVKANGSSDLTRAAAQIKRAKLEDDDREMLLDLYAKKKKELDCKPKKQLQSEKNDKFADADEVLL